MPVSVILRKQTSRLRELGLGSFLARNKFGFAEFFQFLLALCNRRLELLDFAVAVFGLAARILGGLAVLRGGLAILGGLITEALGLGVKALLLSKAWSVGHGCGARSFFEPSTARSAARKFRPGASKLSGTRWP